MPSYHSQSCLLLLSNYWL